MKQDLKSIGEMLKRRRNELNLTLREVENGTSIRMGHLKAIEEGEKEKLISHVYAQGFIKQYASFLGIDGDKLLKENPDILNKPPLQEFAYGIGTLEVRGNPGSSVKWFPNAFWGIIFFMMLLVAWFVAKFFEVI